MASDRSASDQVCIQPTRVRWLLVGAIALAASARTLDARSNWRDGLSVWQRAVASNPHDGDAWSMYVDAVAKTGDDERSRVEHAFAALEQGLYLMTHWNVIMVVPPLTVTREEVDTGIAVLDDVLAITDEYVA